MPHDPDGPPFDSQEVELLLAVFETVCRSLQVHGQTHLPAEAIALKVIDAVKTGERDPVRLHDLVWRTLRNS